MLNNAFHVAHLNLPSEAFNSTIHVKKTMLNNAFRVAHLNLPSEAFNSSIHRQKSHVEQSASVSNWLPPPLPLVGWRHICMVPYEDNLRNDEDIKYKDDHKIEGDFDLLIKSYFCNWITCFWTNQMNVNKTKAASKTSEVDCYNVKYEDDLKKWGWPQKWTNKRSLLINKP